MAARVIKLKRLEEVRQLLASGEASVNFERDLAIRWGISRRLTRMYISHVLKQLNEQLQAQLPYIAAEIVQQHWSLYKKALEPRQSVNQRTGEVIDLGPDIRSAAGILKNLSRIYGMLGYAPNAIAGQSPIPTVVQGHEEEIRNEVKALLEKHPQYIDIPITPEQKKKNGVH